MGLKRFDFNLKDNKKKKSIIVASIIVLVLIVGVTIYATYAAYKVTKTYNIIQGKVGEFSSSDISIIVKLIDAEGNETTADDFPSKDEYTFNYVLSKCKNGSEIEFDEGNWSATINASTKDKCTFYFNYGNALSNVIVADAIKNNYLYSETPDFSKVTSDGEYGLYTAEDDYGTSYYFRGDVVNNYIEFGAYAEDTTISYFECDDYGCNINTKDVAANTPMYWRIVRINGDGSVRLIYDGTEKVVNGTDNIASIAGTEYDATYNNNGYIEDYKYVGYTYENADTQGNLYQASSTIKEVLDDWYNTYLEVDYGKYISDAIFCNDRSGQRTDENGTLYYASYDRLVTNKKPALTCTNKEDRYTINTTAGNGLLSNPVGLITADEIALSGGVYNQENSSYYLYANYYGGYWTMTPAAGFSDQKSNVWSIGESSYDWLVIDSTHRGGRDARPVINLKTNVTITGEGTVDNPYVIVTD